MLGDGPQQVHPILVHARAALQEQRQGRPQFAIRVEPGVRGVLGALAARGSLPEHLGRLSGRLLRAAGPLLAGAGARAEVLGGPGGPRSLRWARPAFRGTRSANS